MYGRLSLLLLALAPVPAFAGLQFYKQGFEDGQPAYTTGSTGAGAATIVNFPEPVFAGQNALRFDLNVPGNGTSEQNAVNVGLTYGTLRETELHFQALVTSGSLLVEPFAYFALDVNLSGSYEPGTDAFIIGGPIGGGFPVGSWYQISLDRDAKIHIPGYYAQVEGKLMKDILEETALGVAWGDMPILGAFVGSGRYNASGFTHTAYIDEVTVVIVPEAATAAGVLLIFLPLLRRRERVAD